MRFVFKKGRAISTFRAITVGTVILGGIFSLEEIWALIDLCMCSVVIINVYSIVRLSPKVVFLWNNFKEQMKEGKEPVFKKEMMKEGQEDIEGW